MMDDPTSALSFLAEAKTEAIPGKGRMRLISHSLKMQDPMDANDKLNTLI